MAGPTESEPWRGHGEDVEEQNGSDRVEARIFVDEGALEDIGSLDQWLANEDAFRGRVKAVRKPIGPEEMGGAVELLSVAVSPGGAGAVLASSLTTWLLTRRSKAKLRIEADDRVVVLELATVDEVGPLLERLLLSPGTKNGDGGSIGGGTTGDSSTGDGNGDEPRR
ncbi:hypothetical protein GCM10009839_68310 [Catenulispora yoronensis]|uniref:Uncharacterized protein n=1 Tax=Catenulispora yoronensis TaxID=450799 RepID=A0ABP5GTD3_9ACTN